MKEGLYHKFAKNPTLKEKLLATAQSVLVECNPADSFWSCGLNLSDWQIICNPGKWPGANMLGVLLMEVREELKDQ